METTFDPSETTLFSAEQPPPSAPFPQEIAAESRPEPYEPEEKASVDPMPPCGTLQHAAAAVRTCVLYVDADNQLPLCAGTLVETCRVDLAVGAMRAFIAGNNSGRQVDNWSEALRAGAEDIAIHALKVPTRKEAADLALVMELGANLKDHIASHELVIIVSRDDFLIGAAERARSLGCTCIIACGTGAPVSPRDTSLPTLILPMPDKGTMASTAPRPNAPAAPSPVAFSPDTAALTSSQILAKVRAELSQQPGGGYAAGPLGSLLAKLGLDADARKQFLSEARGVRTLGSGPEKRYLFSS
jgi:hypothetical protein